MLQSQKAAQKTSLALCSSSSTFTVTQYALSTLYASLLSALCLLLPCSFCTFHSCAPRRRESECLVVTSNINTFFSSIQMKAFTGSFLIMAPFKSPCCLSLSPTHCDQGVDLCGTNVRESTCSFLGFLMESCKGSRRSESFILFIGKKHSMAYLGIVIA